ncbi:TauD/TfdA family dioxygenase [Aetokthonos hydrillicola Thurmond2011]|jgi:alpha-ketoglutarate-dependent taurine dioxygenase|uniref:TauD/TfdA family dioxygenase n=1 Tax=Aetokthonos hydrillicola Thurmond2011 TaxID=2712845 RepID=A0AAP5M995_9CYAN|nr:TauD/TfdA family dioxygenase [Aetokthonos hydrillicola]MBO3458675.1 TauD/TfdA family dioxygenase [Aetokthonos hydrillicola CCALA 1050]MBW4588028.1 TauD/TfdA family dioxygenase [Aetokthonos hydrillicola CCALA 1050]MDR9897020.1 TauD/TfdA family dioxygenase [Aetokthonos hydrillicola Thurmond2011]
MKEKNTQLGISKFSSLRNVQRRAVNLSSVKLIQTGFISSQQTIPFVIQPLIDGLDITEWTQNNQGLVKTLFLQHRALLFRGFKVKTTQQFQDFVKASSDGELLTYVDRSSPRTAVAGQIYTSTVYPAEYPILLHHELTYTIKYPLKLYFCSLKVAPYGGETPIADARKAYQRIDEKVRNEFIEKKWMLVRNYNDGFGLPWQEVFQTDDKAKVEAYCRENSIDFSWKGGSRLQTRQIREAVHYHPQTGEPMWFNHVAFFHHTNLLSEFDEHTVPYNTYYGDGSAIAPDVIQHINQAYQQEKVTFPWQEGDILMLDNMSIAHGRESYKGERQVFLAMSEPLAERTQEEPLRWTERSCKEGFPPGKLRSFPA